MLTHVVYNEVINTIDHNFCARITRREVERQVHLMIGEFTHEKGMKLPNWEIKLLSRQLVHDLPSNETHVAA